MTSQLAHWQFFEVILDRLGGVGEQFTNRSIAAEGKVTPDEASYLLRCYLDAQRRPNAKTKYVLNREHRTSAAIWTIGRRTRDAEMIVGQTGDDILNRLEKAVEPDLRRLVTLNPRIEPRLVGLHKALEGLALTVEGLMETVGWVEVEEELTSV